MKLYDENTGNEIIWTVDPETGEDILIDPITEREVGPDDYSGPFHG